MKRRSFKGENNPFYGKRHNQDSKLKNSLKHRRKDFYKKSVVILCMCGCGEKKNLYDNKYRKSFYKIGHSPKPSRKQSNETRIKISCALKGIKRSDSFKIKVSDSLKGHKVSEETKKKISIKNRGKTFTKEQKRKVSEGLKKKISVANKENMKRLWLDEEYKNKQRKKVLQGLIKKPNKPEITIINLIQQNNLAFEYIGDGKEIIKGFNPDFINKNKKLILEVFGDYWHNLPDVKERDNRRFIVYTKMGYKTLVIWEHELKEPTKVLNKVNSFINGS